MNAHLPAFCDHLNGFCTVTCACGRFRATVSARGSLGKPGGRLGAGDAHDGHWMAVMLAKPAPEVQTVPRRPPAKATAKAV